MASAIPAYRATQAHAVSRAGEASIDTDEALARVRHSLVFGSGLALLALAVGAIALARKVGRPLRQTEEALREAAATLEARVYERTMALEQANERITAQMLRRENAERRLARLNADLEHQVRLRTAELTALNSELEAFTYSVSHDLRAPLRAIDGFSQALIEEAHGELGERALAHLRRVRHGVTRMRELIDDLLTLARVNRSELRRTRVDLSALAAEVLEGLRLADSHRTVQLEIEPGLTAEADPQLVRIVLENLLGNAWKFTAKATRPTIAFGATRDQGERAFFVRDDGAGFDMAYAGKLFAPFQRLHSASEFEGTGIGLATVQRIVRRHGGRIVAHGRVGEGATFTFTFEPPPREAADAGGASIDDDHSAHT